jgi:lambda family phage tail tape measure protein
MADAKITIGAVDQTQAAIASARRNLQGLGDQVGGLGLAFGGLGLALTAAFTGASLHGVIQVMDQLDAMSERTGISVEALSSLRVAAQLSDTNMEALAVGLKKLSTNMADAIGGSKEAAAKFAAMGISPEQLAGYKTADQLFAALADKFKGYQDGAAKNALATDIFGKRGEEMIGVLNRGSQGLADMAEEAKKLGVVFDGSLAKQASDLNDNIERIKLAAEGAKNGLLESLLPALVRITNELVEGRKAFGGWLSFASEMGFKRNPLDSWADSAKKASEGIDTVQKMIANLEARAANPKTAGAGNQSRLTAARGELVELERRRDYFNKLGLDSLTSESNRLEAAFIGGSKPGAPAVKKGSADKPEDDPGIQILNRLTKEYEGLTVSISLTAQVERELAALKKPVTEERRKEIMDVAALTEAQMRAAAAAKNLADLAVGELEAREKLETAYDAELTSLNRLARDQQFELSLINQLPEAIAKARFEREQANQEREAEAKLVALGLQAGWDENRMLEERAKITRELRDRRDAFGAMQADEHAKLYDPQRGMAEGVKEYMLEISKTGEIMQRSVVSAFKGMEDALVDFVKTGKLDFKSLADQIVSDMIRIQVQQSVTQPLAKLVQSSGGLGGIFSGLGSLLGFRASGGPVQAGMPYVVGENQPELFVPDSNGTIVPSVPQGGGGVTVNQPITINAPNASAETVGQIRALMPGFIVENARVVEGVIQRCMRLRGGSLVA